MELSYTGLIFAGIGAVLAIALPGLGSIIGTSIAGRAASGIVSENPDLFGKALLLEALMSSQAVYGFLVFILVLQKVGFVGGTAVEISSGTGLLILMGCLPVAMTALFSAIAQGQIAASGMGVIARHSDAMGKAIILAAMAETFAVFGLLGSILLLQGIAI
jgi:V/A-type H+-transporting ATPase subunit K